MTTWTMMMMMIPNVTRRGGCGSGRRKCHYCDGCTMMMHHQHQESDPYEAIWNHHDVLEETASMMLEAQQHPVRDYFVLQVRHGNVVCVVCDVWGIF